VLSQGRVPAYLNGDRCASIPPRWADNRAMAAAHGAPRAGPAWLGGLLVGGRCARRLLPASSGKTNPRRYTCRRATLDSGVPGCLSRSGAFLDAWGVAPILPVLQPASFALSLAAAHALRTERAPRAAHGQPR